MPSGMISICLIEVRVRHTGVVSVRSDFVKSTVQALDNFTTILEASRRNLKTDKSLGMLLVRLLFALS